MCGICGILPFNNNKEEMQKITRMVALLSHRGPDAQGCIILDRIALGHTRLSIIDTSEKANQPMTDETKKYWIVFNGEIYNYQHIRDELIALGHCFVTTSDTEVILHGYKQWHAGVLDRLRGMFSFAIWDTVKQELFIARDRIGEKPFVYALYNNCFYFASEINALLACDIPKDIDELGVLHYFGTMTSIPPPLTIYKHIKKLEQAHYAIIKHNTLLKQKYWHINFAPDKSLSEQEWIERFSAKLKEVVELTLTADVPLGLCLSGGVDSSTLCALAHASKPNLQYFVLSSAKEDDPELKRSTMVANRFGFSPHVTTFPVQESYESIAEIVNDYGEPFCLYEHIYGLYFNKHIRSYVKTIITGTGADEILCGYVMYNNFINSFKYHLYSAVNYVYPVSTHINYFYMYKNILNQSKLLLNDNILNKHSYSDITQPYHHIFNGSSFSNPLSAKCFYDLLYYHYHSTVYYPDIASMHYGLELRSPFLEHGLIELIAQLPPTMLIRDKKNPLYNKYILKKSMENILPQEILHAPKMGFGYGIDYYTSMKTKWKKTIDDIITAKREGIAEYINTTKIQLIWNAFQNGDVKAGRALFTMLCFLHWWDYNSGDSP